MMAAIPMEKFSGLIQSAKFSADVPSKLDNLRKLKDEFSLAEDPHLVTHFFPQLVDLHTDRCSPVRRFVAEIAGAVGLNHTDLIPDIVPLLVTLLRDGMPAVARQAITCGISLFRHALMKIAMQGLSSSELDDSLESSWLWMLKLKDEIYSIAYQPESDGRKLVALKFVEAVTLLYTADPSASSDPPEDQTCRDEFNIAWLRGGHPTLKIADLSMEASKNLGLLLDQLRYPAVKSHSNLVVIVLIKSLSEIAKKRPSFYGRILPVLLGLDPSNSAGHNYGVHHALKNAFLTCLKCTHPGAAPWRDRLVGTLREMKAGGLAEEALQQVTQEDIKPSIEVGKVRKRPSSDDVKVEEKSGPVQKLISMFSSLVAQGEQSAGMLEILISSISPDLLAQVVIANMPNLPPLPPLEDSNSHTVTQPHNHDNNLSAYLTDMLSKSTTTSQLTPIDEKPLQQVEVEQPAAEKDNDIVIPSEDIEITGDDVDDGIPGLESSSTKNDEMDTSPVENTITKMEVDLEENTSSVATEELSPKPDINMLPNSSSLQLTPKFVLPKISAPVVNLTDEEKDHMQKLAFIRVLEAYKHTPVAGGSHLRFSLLSYLGVEFPLELDPWSLLQTHILSDYINHEGHELTLRVLYRLFGEAEAEHDFFSSTTATSVYEMFLVKVAEALRDNFPASDKSLSRLLNEVPYLPKLVVKLLECLCVPEDLHSGDRVHQGLSIVWSLILLRPPTRDVCLNIALQSAVHHLEEVQTKAIRLVANRLYPMPSISQQIEDFALKNLLSAMNTESPMDTQTEKSLSESVDSEVGQQLCTSPSPSVTDAQRSMSLYFALCTKKHSLFRQLLIVYKNMPKAAKQAISVQIPKLVRTIGSSSQLLEIIADPPAGSENLLMQVVQTLTDGAIPSPELIATIKKLYDTKLKDAEILIPVLPFLPKDELLGMFSCFVNLPVDKFQTALARTLQQGTSEGGPVVTPAEVMIAIHAIDPDKDGIPLKKVTDACNICFQQREIFTQQVVAKVLNQLVEHIPLPMLFMRTVIQTIGAFPSLVDFIMEILSRLVSKQIWKNQKLWVGFLKCAQLTKPKSLSVVLQLPPAQLEIAINKQPALKGPLVSYASQPDIQTSLPRSILVVLGIQQSDDSQGQTIQAVDTSNSVVEEEPKESTTN